MSAYDSIIKGLNEAIEYERGNLKGVRTHTVKILPLPMYPPMEIRKIRTGLKLTQLAFANIVGVSKKTVEAWECGRNVPQGPSLRMIEILENNGQDLVKRYVMPQ